MRLAIIYASLALCANTVLAAEKTREPTAAFKVADQEASLTQKFAEFAAEASKVTSWSEVISDKRTGQYTKFFFNISDIEYDVKKTDSLISPIVGKVRLFARMQKSGPFPSENEAGESKGPAGNFALSYEVNLSYVPNGSAWMLKEYVLDDHGRIGRIVLKETGENARAGKSSLEKILKHWIL